jgi:hypothetical protein
MYAARKKVNGLNRKVCTPVARRLDPVGGSRNV